MSMLGPCASFCWTATKPATTITSAGRIQTKGSRVRRGGSATARGRSSGGDTGGSVIGVAVPQQALVERLGGEHGQYNHGAETKRAQTHLNGRQRADLHQRHEQCD